mmetsp:Transcript_52717/g.123278  ORF Transcript_52717/g.123278 Transcript_52717/m.123278 type:complete len:384 (-) Transcript_52717:73-1224(-)
MSWLSWMHLPLEIPACNEPTLVNIVLLLAITANALLILAPYRSALRAANIELTMAELVGLLTPTFALFAQSYLWACYGYVTNQPHIQHFNAWGAGMCLLYLGIIARGSGKLPVLRSLLVLCVSAVIMFSLSVFMAPATVLDRRRVFSYAAITFSILQSLAPMNHAMEAVQQRTADHFPFLLTISSGWTSLLWAQYAAMVHDDIYFLANAVGVALSILELTLAGWVTLLSSETSTPQFNADVDQQPLMPMWRDLRSAAGKGLQVKKGAYGSIGGKLDDRSPDSATRSWSSPLSAFKEDCPTTRMPLASRFPVQNSKSAFSAAHELLDPHADAKEVLGGLLADSIAKENDCPRSTKHAVEVDGQSKGKGLPAIVLADPAALDCTL